MHLSFILLIAAAQIPVVESADFTAEVQTAAVVATVRVLDRGRTVEGSGVVVGADSRGTYVLTAAHLVDPDSAIDVEVFTAASHPKPAAVFAKVEVVARSKGLRDLALLRLPRSKPAAAQLQLAPVADPALPTPFSCLVVGCVAGQPPCVRLDKVLAAQRARRESDEEPAWFWKVESKQGAGQSGGPLVDRDGFVLGICSGNNKGQSYFCHIDEIRAFLTEHKYQWLCESRPVPKSKE